MASGGDMKEVVVSMSKASIEVKDEGKKKIDRHCAFCLTLVKGEEVKTCSKCKRRAYCSKECQKADWTQAIDIPATNGKICGYGQGHKNWCGLPYGEEDLDWKVVPISGKGLGIVALRDIPYFYRIMVEGMQQLPGNPYLGSQNIPLFHPAMNDLHPPNSDIAAKFLQNHVNARNEMRVGLRLSRINHSCRPNAAFTVDPHPNFAIVILCSQREIKAGEEIFRSYAEGHNFPFRGGGLTIHQIDVSYKTPEEFREELLNKWGIVCPPSCPCRDEKNVKLLEELKEFGEYCATNRLKEPALQKLQKIIENAKEFGLPPEHTSSLYMCAFQLSVTRRQTLDQAEKYLQMALEIMQAVLHPKSQAKPKVFPDLTSHPDYLAAER